MNTAELLIVIGVLVMLVAVWLLTKFDPSTSGGYDPPPPPLPDDGTDPDDYSTGTG